MSLPPHHADSNQTAFKNPWPSARRPTWKDLSFTAPVSWYRPRTHSHPSIKVVKPDWGVSDVRDGTLSRQLVGTWLGHAAALVEFTLPAASKGHDNFYVLFDPIFSMRAGPNAYIGPGRFNQPPCKVQDLPGCHAVCISHNHYDHLDAGTVAQVLECFPSVRWFVPLGIKPWLLACGAKQENVEEMDWWQGWDGFKREHTNDSTSTSFKITCVPAQHTSGRTGRDVDSTLWCGWVIESHATSTSGTSRKGAVYHAGDTGYRPSASSRDVCPVFKEIGTRFHGLDLSFVPIWRGGSLSSVSYVGLKLHHHQLPSWNHCSPDDAVKIHQDVKSATTVAVHFATFVGGQRESDEALDEFTAAVESAGLRDLDAEAGAEGRAGAINIGQSIVIPLAE